MVNVPQGLQDLTVHVELNASVAGVDVDLELYDPGPDTFLVSHQDGIVNDEKTEGQSLGKVFSLMVSMIYGNDTQKKTAPEAGKFRPQEIHFYSVLQDHCTSLNQHVRKKGSKNKRRKRLQA